MPLFGPPNIEKLKEKRDVEGLVRALRHKDREISVNAVTALRELSDVNGLIKALAHKGFWVRDRAARWLGELHDPRAVKPLIVALRDSGSIATADALGKLGDPRAVEPLIDSLSDIHSYIRESAATALGKLGDPRAFEPLIAALHDDGPDVRSSVLEALGKSGDSRAVEPMMAALEDKSPAVQEAAARALANLGDSAVESLIAVLKDTGRRKRVRQHAARGLKNVGRRDATEALFEYREREQEEQERRKEGRKLVAERPKKTQPTFDDFIVELIQIGRSVGYLSEIDQNVKGFTLDVNRRVRTIGGSLNRMGGTKRMLEAHAYVRAAIGDIHARKLEVAWGGIGDWRP